MKRSAAQFLIPVVLLANISSAARAEPANSVNLGLGGIIHTMPHCYAKVYTAEYEHLVTPTIALLGRASEVHYRFDNGQYFETGKPRGLDLGARYYPAGNMQGFYVGGTLGYWKADWSFIQYQNKPYQFNGQAQSNSARLNFDIGDRIRIGGTNFSIMPEVNFGKFFSTSSCN